jgi:quercetin dioxygenase-like cupin family protein
MRRIDDIAASTEQERKFVVHVETVPRRTTMTDTTIKKVNSAHSPTVDQGEVYLASGKRLAMRLWREEPPTDDKPTHAHEYEVVGYVIAGRAELELEGQKVTLEPGDSWLVPANAQHTYRILETFTAVEATAPPFHVHAREG